MALNHVPSDLHWITDRPVGLFSAAEGFVFLSGLLSGIIYTRHLRSQGRRHFVQGTRTRATRIYAWHLGAFLAVFALVHLVDSTLGLVSANSPRLFHTHPLAALGLGMLMLYQPGLLDILPMYCAFTLLLVWVLPALERRRYPLVLGCSFALWLLMQAAPAVDGAPLYPLHVGAFNLLAWQFLFVLGAALGHWHTRRKVHHARLPSHPLLVGGAAAFAVYAWGIHHWHWWQPLPDAVFGAVLNKPALGALRLADFLAVAYLVALLGRWRPNWLRWPALAFLGRHSLSVMAAQTVAVSMLLLFCDIFELPLFRGLANAALIGVLFLAAWLESEFGRKRRRAPAAAPAPALPVNPAYGVRSS